LAAPLPTARSSRGVRIAQRPVYRLAGRPDQLGDLLLGQVVGDPQPTVFLGAEPFLDAEPLRQPAAGAFAFAGPSPRLEADSSTATRSREAGRRSVPIPERLVPAMKGTTRWLPAWRAGDHLTTGLTAGSGEGEAGSELEGGVERSQSRPLTDWAAAATPPRAVARGAKTFCPILAPPSTEATG
jgi:hypothetical protein